MNTIDLDDYLADLGISQDDEAPPMVSVAPTSAHLPAAESLSPQATLTRFLEGLVARLGAGYGVTVRTSQDEPEVLEAEITGEKAAKLAGRDGQVLHAIEVLSYAVLTRQFGPSELKVRVDAGGYRQRQSETLGSLAQRLAAQVAKSGEPHELQPMNASERRIIHVSLQDHPLVVTESRGEGKGRHLVILPRG